MKRWKRIYHAKGSETKAGITIFPSNKIDLKTKAVTRHKEGLGAASKENQKEKRENTPWWG